MVTFIFILQLVSMYVLLTVAPICLLPAIRTLFIADASYTFTEQDLIWPVALIYLLVMGFPIGA